MLTDEGNYHGNLINGVMDTAKSSGEAVMQLLFQVEYYASNGNWARLDQPLQRTVWVSLSRNALPYAEQKLAVLGFQGDYGDPQFVNPDDSTKPVSVALICRHETYENKDREKWDLVKWGEQREATPPDDNTIRTLNQKWRTSQSASQAPAGEPGPPAATTATTVDRLPPGDDIPF